MIQLISIFVVIIGTVFLYFNKIDTNLTDSNVFIHNHVLRKKIDILRQHGIKLENPVSKIIESKGEKLCRETLQKIYSKEFVRIRPDFLKNPKTGRNLELDCYNAELKIAVEYNGAKSHYTDDRQMENDKYKKNKCKELGIAFISVPFTVPEKQIENYLIYKLKRKGLIPENKVLSNDDNTNDENVDIDEIPIKYVKNTHDFEKTSFSDNSSNIMSIKISPSDDIIVGLEK